LNLEGVLAQHVIDLQHLGIHGAIAAYLITDPEPTIIDPGPSTTLDRLHRGLAALGVEAAELRHVVLTHIHLDHAGATGHLAQANPALSVHVHSQGLPHMADPERLVSSTRRTFGESHDRLWGDVEPVPEGQLVAADAEGWNAPAALRAIPTPGHIVHHLSYLSEVDGTMYSGDSMGIILGKGAPSHPPTPPPSLDLAAWLKTLEMLGTYDPDRIAVTHFGIHGDFHERRAQLAESLGRLRDRVARALETGDMEDARRYHDEVVEQLQSYRGQGRIKEYFETFPAMSDWAGMRLYLERLAKT
jgi:glyoxylase-like metal-dependent hydrolase (beta-lactamase superfamily II)